ncbi:molybdopterin-dependent oxidoreductase [Streptomyces sp. CA-135486]|uniref:molybdopterin-dependent oxidoreductase n=1 Tax=Streptomyces sp. CA-135486 TaxID=3240049 RepID=UPI003D8A538D
MSLLQWDQRAVGCAHFAGVPFRPLAELARLEPAAVEVVFAGAERAPGQQAPYRQQR